MTPDKLNSPEKNNIPKKDQQSEEKPYIKPQEGIVASFNNDCKTKRGIEFNDNNKINLSKLFSKTNNRDEIYTDIMDIIETSEDVNADLEIYLQEILGNQTKIDIKQTENSNEQTEFRLNEEKTESNENKKLRNAELEKRGQQFDELANSLSTLDGNGKNDKYQSILLDVINLKTLVDKNGFTEEYDEKIKSLLAELKNNPDTLRAIFLDLQRQDPRKAESFATALISLDSDFRGIIPTIEAKSKLALGNDTLQDASITGKEITQTQDGYTTTAKLDGTDRTIGLADSKYRMKSTLESDKEAQAEADKIEQDLRKYLEPIHVKLQNFEAIKTHLEIINSPNDKNMTDIKKVKADIKSLDPEIYVELGLENMTSLAEIQTAINTHEEKLIKERDAIEYKAKAELDNLVQRQKERYDKEQVILKKYLNLYNKTGFDIFTNDQIKDMFSPINNNPGFAGLQQKIDLETCSIGFDNDNGDKELNDFKIQNFCELANRTLFGNPFFPIAYENGRYVYYASEEDAKNKIPAPATFNIQEFIRISLGQDPIRTAQRNLENSIINYGKIGSKTQKQNKDEKK